MKKRQKQNDTLDFISKKEKRKKKEEEEECSGFHLIHFDKY